MKQIVEIPNISQELLSILVRVAEHGPSSGLYQPGAACGFCDMGYAGYSSRGDGFHDDECAVKDAQEFLERAGYIC